MTKQTAILLLLALAIATTIGCGTSTTASSVPTFTKVAFLSNRAVTPPTVLFTANLDGTSVTPIPRTAGSLAPQGPLSTSADGKTVAFVAYTGVAWVLAVSNVDGTGQQALTTPGGNVYWDRISPDGKHVVYSDATSHISVINPDGTSNLDLTPTLPANMTVCYNPSFSADSTQVVFTCSGNGAFGIYTIKADGTSLTTVETRTSKPNYAFLTPDGKKVLFMGNFATGFGIGSVNIDGTGETLLVPASFPEIVVLNSSLYYRDICSSTSTQIFKANLDGTKPVAVSDSANDEDLISAGNGC